MYIQISDLNRVVSWNVGENAIGDNSPDIKEITVPLGVNESNFNQYVWQSDNTLLHDALVVDLRVTVSEVRSMRDSKLLSSDWRASIADYPHSDLAAWLTYRQALRDFPANYTPTENPVWPAPPE